MTKANPMTDYLPSNLIVFNPRKVQKSPDNNLKIWRLMKRDDVWEWRAHSVKSGIIWQRINEQTNEAQGLVWQRTNKPTKNNAKGTNNYNGKLISTIANDWSGLKATANKQRYQDKQLVWRRDEGSGLTKNKQREVGGRPKWAIILFVNIDRRRRSKLRKQTKATAENTNLSTFTKGWKEHPHWSKTFLVGNTI